MYMAKNDGKGIPPSEKLALTPHDLQQVLGIGRTKVYELINEDCFPVVRLGRKILIPRSSLLEWLKQESK